VRYELPPALAGGMVSVDFLALARPLESFDDMISRNFPGGLSQKILSHFFPQPKRGAIIKSYILSPVWYRSADLFGFSYFL